MVEDSVAAYSAAQLIDRRIRYAMRILENEQTPLPTSADVAARVGLSLFHFVRLFIAEVGLSPRDYGRSIVMMHSASRLRYSADPIDVVAKNFGYAKQATFTKAFTRHHGVPPARWRAQAKREIVLVSGEGVRLERLPVLRCFARRYLGPRSLTTSQWVDFVGHLPPDLLNRPRLRFAYDDPRVTPPGRIRHDCAVVVDGDAVLTNEMADDGFELLESPAGLWAVADVIGPKVSEGYRAVQDGWFPEHRGYAFEGDPFLERTTTTRDGDPVISVFVRVRPIAEEGNWNMPVLPPG